MHYASRSLSACLILCLAACAAAPPQSATPETSRVFLSPAGEHGFLHERTLYGKDDLDAQEEKAGLLALITGESANHGNVEAGMTSPLALAVMEGRVFVVNEQDPLISVFDIPHQRFHRVGADSLGILQMPSGLSIDRAGNLFVADSGRNAILMFDREGKYLRGIGGPRWFSHLKNVTVDPRGDRIYAIDAGDEGHRVRVFNALDGNHLFDFGTRGHGPGEFNAPYDLAVGKNGRLYVVDSGNFRVQIFDHDGKYQRSFGASGKRPGQFSRPKEIAADAEGRLYVVDSIQGNFQVFDPDGGFLYFIGTHGEEGGAAKYMLPTGIDVDAGGRIYVADQWFGKMEIFRPVPAKNDNKNLSRGDVPESVMK